jgi:predicted ATP-binding protein involved in virulence
MYLRRVEVENFRCFEKSAWEFAPGFNVFIGDNGAGKTAILDALAVAAGTFFLGIDGVHKRNIQNRDVRSQIHHIGEQPILSVFYPAIVNVDIDFFEASLKYQRKLSGKSNKNTSPKNKDIQFISMYFDFKSKYMRIIDDINQNRINNKELISSIMSSEMNESLNHQIESNEKLLDVDLKDKLKIDLDIFPDGKLNFPLVSYYGAGRAWLHKQRKTNLIRPVERIQGYENCLEASSDEKFLLDWFQTREIAALQHGGASPALEGIREAVRLTLGEEWGRIWYDVDLAEIIAERSDGVQMPVSLLSDGQRNLLSMALDIAYRCAVLNPHLGEKASQITPGVVLIDEIDLHLHPNWQHEVVGNLRKAFPKVQFFITTHSPIILQGLNPKQDRVFRLGNGKTTIESPEEYVDRPLEDILTDVQGYDAFQMSARRQAMIEAAEAYYTALEQAKTAKDEAELAKIKARMDELALPFHDNPAYIAFLNMERQAALGERA